MESSIRDTLSDLRSTENEEDDMMIIRIEETDRTDSEGKWLLFCAPNDENSVKEWLDNSLEDAYTDDEQYMTVKDAFENNPTPTRIGIKKQEQRVEKDLRWESYRATLGASTPMSKYTNRNGKSKRHHSKSAETITEIEPP
jgi:hypothetical protein